jgi:hypothetical protein
MLGFQFVAVLAAVLFTGAALYINLVEHPSRMECGTQLAATVFGPSYRRAAVMQVTNLAGQIRGIRSRIWHVKVEASGSGFVRTFGSRIWP